MGRFRFSLAALFGLVACAAVGCTALVNASHWWACALFTTAVAACVLAALIAVARHGRTRSTAVGFTIAGATYLLVMFSPLLGQNIGAPRILTREALLALHPHVERPVMRAKAQKRVGLYDTSEVWSADLFAPIGQAMPPSKKPTWTHFEQVGHSLFALAFAFVGAVLARWLYVRREGRP